MPEFTGAYFQNIPDEHDFTDQVKADPELKQNMLENGLLEWFMGRYILSAKGKAVLHERKRLANQASARGITHYAPKPSND